ncbi:MAG TPA: sugar ABC transporter ATP-binding protein [Blastocatellia bacterium]|nr:sugar ABC transporter ATP-binding protein [Blastocatellia bacterium]
MKAPTLQMRKIEKRFPGVYALKGVDLEVNAGEVVALLGENGAGKSTLMKVLGGVHQPDSGEVLIDGAPVVIHNVADATRYGIAFIHQELNVLDNLDVAANVFLGREPVRGGFLRLVDSRKMREETEKHLKRLGLDIPPDTPLAKLSIAQQQMVEIAKALSLDARILIMDEPTSSLTLTETARLLEVVKELRAQGVSVIYITHRLGEVQEIADRAVVLRDGANAGSLARAEINHDNMVKLMVGRDLETFYQHPAVKKTPGYFTIESLRTARYPDKQVSFEVGKGEILGLAGLVGAGRSETAQAIFGVDRAVEASFKLDGQPLRIGSPQDAIQRGVYLVPEDRRTAGLITDITIRENVTLPALDRYAPAGLISSDKERRSAEEMCGRLNVKTPSVEVKAANLSGGNQQKVVLAKWLALEPKVLIFDEPTRGIDVGAKAEIYELMRKLAESGVAIIMISSDMEEVLHISDRVAVMHEGRVTGVLERDECTEENIMRLAVGGRDAGQEAGGGRQGAGGRGQ